MNDMIMGYGGYFKPQGGYESQHTNANSQTKQAVSLIGRHIKVNRGGPEVVEGLLIAVPSDYLVLASLQGIIYVNGSHVKSMTEGTKSNHRSRSHSYIAASSFQSLLNKLSHQFVQINRGGPEKIEGFLAEVNSQFLLLIAGREFVRVPIFHIKTVNVTTDGNKSSSGSRSGSGGNKNNNNKSNKNNNKSGSSGNKNNNKSGNKSNNKSGKNNNKSGGKSGNNKSGGNRKSGRN